MRVLHLLSEWKWTGPSESVVFLCEALKNLGLDVRLAVRCSPKNFYERTVEEEARLRGIKICDGMRLNRYFSFKDWIFDMRALRRYVKEERIDLVHTHLSHDHVLAVLSFLFSRKPPIVVRTDHKREGIDFDPFIAYILSRTDGLVTFSERMRKKDMENFLFPAERTIVVPFGLKVFEGRIEDKKEELGLPKNLKIIGVAGRLKRDRFYGVIIEAFSLLKKEIKNVKLVILGRSSQVEKSIFEPVKRYGVDRDVIFAGYKKEDYFSFLSTFDIFVMMRAGSDGTARALREAMALSKPAIVSNLGMLPDIVEDGVCGYTVPLDPFELAEKMKILLLDEKKRKNFGEAAKKRALEWDYRDQAKKVQEFYIRLLKMGKRE